MKVCIFQNDIRYINIMALYTSYVLLISFNFCFSTYFLFLKKFKDFRILFNVNMIVYKFFLYF